MRTQAVFWVSQAAGEKATQGLAEVVGDAAADQEVRLSAVSRAIPGAIEYFESVLTRK